MTIKMQQGHNQAQNPLSLVLFAHLGDIRLQLSKVGIIQEKCVIIQRNIR